MTNPPLTVMTMMMMVTMTMMVYLALYRQVAGKHTVLFSHQCYSAVKRQILPPFINEDTEPQMGKITFPWTHG